MKWFNNRRMAAKLTLAFGVCVVLTAGVGFQALSGLEDMRTTTVALETYAKALAAAKDMNLGIVQASRAVANAVLDDEKTDVKRRIDDVQADRKEYTEALAAFEKTLVSDDAKQAVAELHRLDLQIRPAQDEILGLALEGKDDVAKTKLKADHAIADAVDAQIDVIEKTEARVMAEAMQASDDAYASTIRLTVIAVLGAVVLAIVIGFVLTRLITKPLADSVRVLKAVAQADFSQSLALDSTDELGDLARALNQASQQMNRAVSEVRLVATAMAQGDMTIDVNADLPGMLGEMAAALGEATVKVRTALNEVRAASDTVASAAQQLASSSEEISGGAQEQASSLEETAASLEEITATIKQNADNAQQASQLAGGARTAAENGGQVVNDAIAAMTTINASSKQIAEITTTIDEIAFQTNLLALNAAVEAARAGEQGRGFAVVASEVRSLAQRSALAAKEIKGLIQDSVRKVEAGSELVNASGRTLGEIVTAVKRVTDIVSEIAAASREQSGGIEQVNKAVTQMDQVTQANASQTEEMSGTAESLSAEAGKLQALILQFKLGAESIVQARVASKPAARRPVAMARPARTGVRQTAASSPRTAGALALDTEFSEF